MTREPIDTDGVDERDARGEWRPPSGIGQVPVFVWPPRPLAFLRTLVAWDGFVLPWNAFYILVATLTWLYLTPDLHRMQVLQWDWMVQIYLRNVVLLVVFAGVLHFRLYVQKAQGRRFKYNGEWLGERNTRFLFASQVLDNMFYSIASGATVWSAYEIVTMWAYANNWIPYAGWSTNPVWFVAVFFLLPFWRMFHFYWIHRLIHWKPIYKRIHYIHHKNINIGPWSGLSMHPVEHLLYFSTVLIHWILPTHPIHALVHLQSHGLGAIPGHAGFDEIILKGDAKIPNHGYFHYLHHRYHTVNFGEGLVPFDRWFGSYYDGSNEARSALRDKRK